MMLWGIIPLYLIGISWLIPIYLILRVIDWIFKLTLVSALPGLFRWGYYLLVFIPPLLRYVPILSAKLDLDEVFFGVFAQFDGNLSTALRKQVYIPFSLRLWKKLTRTIIQLGLAMLVLCLSYLPYVGKAVFPAAQFYATYGSLGPQASCLIALFALIPAVKKYEVMIFATFYTAHALWRELADPYLSRLDPTKKDSTFRFPTRNLFIFFGFSVPSTVLLSIPVLGPLLFPLMQAAAAVIIAKYCDREKVLHEPLDLASQKK